MLRQPGRTLRVLLGHASWMLQDLHDFRMVLDNRDHTHVGATFFSYTGGLWVGKFLKTCTYQRMTREASREIADITERQCMMEKMIGHAATARIRKARYGGYCIM